MRAESSRLSRASIWLAGGLLFALSLCVLGWVLVDVADVRTPRLAPYELPVGLEENRAARQLALQAPLFWQSRVLEQEGEVPAAVSTGTIEGLRLAGILGQTVLLKPKDKPVKKLMVGDVIEGYKIESVRDRIVVLVANDRRVELSLVPERASNVVLQPVNE